jgi:hypothetical protein
VQFDVLASLKKFDCLIRRIAVDFVPLWAVIGAVSPRHIDHQMDILVILQEIWMISRCPRAN